MVQPINGVEVPAEPQDVTFEEVAAWQQASTQYMPASPADSDTENRGNGRWPI